MREGPCRFKGRCTDPLLGGVSRLSDENVIVEKGWGPPVDAVRSCDLTYAHGRSVRAGAGSSRAGA